MASQLQGQTNPVQKLLDGANSVIRQTRFCWLVTESYDSKPTVRPMGQVLEADDCLQVRFITDSTSRKTEEISSEGRVQLLFSHETADAFVILAGEATVVTDPEAIAVRWKSSYGRYFPTAEDRLRAAFIEVTPRLLKLWIRGVTPEPYGVRPTVLTCGTGPEWIEREG